MATIIYGSGNTKQNLRGDITRGSCLFYRTGSDVALDLTDSFDRESVRVSERRNVNVQEIPYRSSHALGGQWGLATQAALTLKILSRDIGEAEQQIDFIRDFWIGSENGLIDWYYIYNENIGENNNNYYAYLRDCVLVNYNPTRAYAKVGANGILSSVDIDLISLYTKTTRNFPDDSTTSNIIRRGQKIHFTNTNNNSPAFTVARNSDKQALLRVDDKGNMSALGDIKSNQSLPIITL